MIKEFFVERRLHNGYTFEEYTELVDKYIETADLATMNDFDKALYETTKLNQHRSRRINKTYVPDNELIEVIKQIDEKQIWMVITEGWCGDSAQTLPYIAIMARLNSNIDLRILERDKNPDIMEQYLTNGKLRSIPKLVAFDESGKELFQWGPRLEEAQTLVDRLKAEGMKKKEFTEKLHLWYGRNRGKNIELEFIELLRKYLIEKAEV